MKLILSLAVLLLAGCGNVHAQNKKDELKQPSSIGVISTLPSSPQTMIYVPKGTVLEVDRDDKLIVKINLDGSAEYGDGITPNEAAKEFWHAVGEIGPCTPKEKAAQ